MEIKTVNARMVDPLALILSGQAYVKLTLPDPPPPDLMRDDIRDAISRMKPAERQHALARVRALIDLGRAVETAIAGGDVVVGPHV